SPRRKTPSFRWSPSPSHPYRYRRNNLRQKRTVLIPLLADGYVIRISLPLEAGGSPPRRAPGTEGGRFGRGVERGRTRLTPLGATAAAVADQRRPGELASVAHLAGRGAASGGHPRLAPSDSAHAPPTPHPVRLGRHLLAMAVQPARPTALFPR